MTGSTFTGNAATGEGGALDGDDVVVVTSTFESNSAGDGDDGGAVHGDEDVAITDSTFTTNTAEGDGGAVGVRNGTIAVTGATFTGNESDSEGGALHGDDTVTVSDSTFTDNSAAEYGGAIDSWGDSDGTAIVSGSTFTGNTAAEYAGAIDTGAFTITGSTFTNNSTDTDDGGAIWADQSSTLSDSTFTGNSAGGEGGAIYNEADLTLTDSVFTANEADGDGGAAESETEITVTGGNFIENVASDDGGGIAADEVTVSNSTFTDNEADGDGGGLVTEVATVSSSTFNDNDALDGDGGGFDSDAASVTSSSFTGNASSRDGGAFWAEDPSTVDGSTFDSNTASRDGGAIFTEDELTMTNSTFSSNAASGRGGAIAAEAEPLELRFVTMAANRADGGGADVATFELAATLDADGSVFASTGACDLTGASAGGDNFDRADTCGFEEANSIVDGGAPALGPLADNGGTTATRLPAAASPLLLVISDSRCAALATGDLATDQRGVARPSPSGARCTIGSVNTPATVPGTPLELDATSSADGVELSWSAPENDGGSTVTSYVIESSTDGVTWSSAADVAATASAGSTFVSGFGSARRQRGDAVRAGHGAAHRCRPAGRHLGPTARRAGWYDDPLPRRRGQLGRTGPLLRDGERRHARRAICADGSVGCGRRRSGRWRRRPGTRVARLHGRRPDRRDRVRGHAARARGSPPSSSPAGPHRTVGPRTCHAEDQLR